MSNTPTQAQLREGFANENRVSAALFPFFTQRFPNTEIQFGSLPQQSAFDRAIMGLRGGVPHLLGFLEVKARSCKADTYPSTMVHHSKWEFAESAHRYLRVPSFYAILFGAEVWVAEHGRIRGVTLAEGYRGDRGYSSTRLYAYISMDSFTKVTTLEPEELYGRPYSAGIVCP
jgi:hypothetical protein